MFSTTRRRRSLDIWPGFVDALAALLMVLVFVLLVFAMGQFFLSDALTGRDQALSRLNLRITELAEMLSMEEQKSADLTATLGQLRASLAQLTTERDSLADSLSLTTAELETSQSEAASLASQVAALSALKTELEAQIASLATSLDDSRRDLVLATEVSNERLAQVELMNQQLLALRQQITELSEALDISQRTVGAQQTEIEDLAQRLNLALAERVQNLEQYRSEFFGKLRQALGDNPDVTIVGDRFVFQSELLFETASAQLGAPGRLQVHQLVRTLNEVIPNIPEEIDWVLRIDGHTDRRPISSAQFPSNWELSTARALAIVKYMVALGVPPNRLAATGFGEFHPLDQSDSESAWARNRRIEIKLTSR